MTEWIKKTRPIYILPTRLSLEIEFSCEPKSILKKKKKFIRTTTTKTTTTNGNEWMCVFQISVV